MNRYPDCITPRALRRSALALTVVALAALAACGSMPDRNAALDQARQRLEAARAEPGVATLAPEELSRAGTALSAAQAAQARGDSRVEIDHLAYLAGQQVTVAQETATARRAQAVTARAGTERDRMRLELRTAEADAAQRQLAAATQTNARTTQELASAQQSNERKNVQLAQASATSQADRERLASRDAQLGDLQAQLRELNARETPRGMVVTLGDVLFDTGRAQLKGSGGTTMVKLAEFLKRNPKRTAAIEGYTDSVGTYVSNQTLADQRAHSVMAALMQLGVTGERLTTQAFGEENPVGDNKTAAGRQANRRVEVVFSPTANDLLIQK